MEFSPSGEDAPIAKVIGNYELEKQIGVGSFSYVWLAENKISHTKVAVKVIPKKRISKEVNILRFEREVSFLKRLDHPLIAQFFEILEDETYHYFVMELAENGDLLSMVNKTGRMSEIIAKSYFIQLVSVLDYMHTDMMVAHRDLKAENVLLDENNNIRLIDFGFSRSFTAEDPGLNTTCGSPAYVAPEMIKRQTYTVQADVWSLGVLLYALVIGHLPFEDPDNNVQKVLQKIAFNDVFIPRFVSPELKDLLQRMLRKDPERRITMQEIKKHSWFPQETFMLVDKFIRPNEGKVMTIFDVDERVMKEVADLGINVSTLEKKLNNREFDTETAIYLMLRKKSITETLKNVFKAAYSTSIKRSSSNETPGHSGASRIVRRHISSRPVGPHF